MKRDRFAPSQLIRLGVVGALVSWCLIPAAGPSTALGASDPPADLVESGAKVEKLSGGFKFTEGPAADAEGNVFFSDIPNSRIHKWSVDGKLSVFRENTGESNGLYFDKAGNLMACEGGARRVTSTDPKGNVAVLADAYEGKKFNSPNDLWPDLKGGLYFTDPHYGPKEGLEQDGEHVYYLTPDRKKVVRVVHDMQRPNGLIGTPDGKRLYVADNGEGKTYVYAIGEDGSLSDRKLFADVRCDGMMLDEKGNVYLTSKKGIEIFDAAGKALGIIQVPEEPANVTFGGKERKTLFMTARTGLYAVQMKVRGF